MPALLTDLVAFYRSFVVSIYYLWTQGNVRLPSGLTIVQLIRVCILAMGMPRFQAALCMTWPFFILSELFCMRPAKVTTWCVRTQSKTGVPYSGPDPPPVHPTPGTFDHMDAHPDTSGSSSFRAFHHAANWDHSKSCVPKGNSDMHGPVTWYERTRGFAVVDSFRAPGVLRRRVFLGCALPHAAALLTACWS
jgi:hypothetical protein